MKKYLALRMVNRRKRRQQSITELELKHTNNQIVDFNDSSYFAGLSETGFSFVSRMAFRSKKPNENWLKVHIPGEGIWGFENLEMEEGNGFKQGGFEYVCIKPGELWKIKYQGVIYKGKEEKKIKIDLDWESIAPVIDFDVEGTSMEQVASQIAKEKWNPGFFRKLKEIHKVHYEQAGRLKGSIQLDGVTHELDLAGIRDHSFGSRNWNDWERHIWYLGLLEDGRFFNISIVNYDFIKDLKAGFLLDGNRYITHVKTPSFKDLNLHEVLPTQVAFEVQEKKGESEKAVKVIMKEFFPFIMDDVYHIRQAKAEFEYDGVKGIGIAEMGINLKRYKLDY